LQVSVCTSGRHAEDAIQDTLLPWPMAGPNFETAGEFRAE